MYLFILTDPRYVLMNQHMLLHLEKSVRDHGPLWSSSLFVFEDWNGDLSNYFHGTQNIAIQVSKCCKLFNLYFVQEVDGCCTLPGIILNKF